MPKLRTLSANPGVRVSYQGVPGAYSEKATRQLLGNQVKAIGHSSFEEAFLAVQSQEVEYAMVPIENSLGGCIHVNYDLLIRYNLHIVAELDVRVRHCLLAVEGVKPEEITRVISHPQALAQCENYLRDRKFTPCPEYDTAGSAQLLQKSQQRNTAAIASDLAAEYYGLQVLDRDIEDHDTNFTRFFLLSREPLSPPYQLSSKNVFTSIETKTSIVFSFADNKTGQLHRALSAFALRDIDLCKIESRPDKSVQVLNEQEQDGQYIDRRKYRYLMYIDFLGHVQDPNVKNALNHLREFCNLERVLGSYPTSGVLVESIQKAIANDPAQLTPERKSKKRLRIGIVGFGNFGQFLAKTFTKYHDVYATSRSDYSVRAAELGVQYTPMFDLSTFFAQELDVIVLAMSILSFEKITRICAKEWSNSSSKNALVVDVLSVKVHPKKVLKECLPSELDILACHPMFGPESGRYSWKNLPLMYEKVRISSPEVCESFLSIFEFEQCNMIEMTCEAHDEYAASSQFLTHLTGRILGQLKLQETPIDTTGYKSILRLVDNTCKDSYDLFYGLFKHNTNSKRLIRNLQDAMEHVVRHLDLMEKDNEPVLERQQRLSALGESITPSKTVAIHALTKKLAAEGKQVFSLCVGEPDFPPHDLVLQATKDAVDGGHTRYTAVAGTLALRQAIASYLTESKNAKYEATEVVVTSGGKQAVYQSVLATCQKYDEVLIPAPYWVSYPEIVRLAQASPVTLNTSIEDGYLVDPKALAQAITPRTRLLMFCNPSNPTGAVHLKDRLLELAEVLRRPENEHVLILADEMYERLVYGVEHTCFSTLPGMRERTILINGVSKAFAMTGYRIGYLAGPKRYIDMVAKLQGQITSCANSIAQQAAISALLIPKAIDAAYTDEIRKNMQEKRDFVYQRLINIPGVKCSLSDGAFYLFPDISAYFGSRTRSGELIRGSSDLCVYLLENYQTAIVPGSAFGMDEAVRFSYATSMEVLDQSTKNFQECLLSLTRV